MSGCNAIVHLAAMNRHGDPQVIYDTNLKLVGNSSLKQWKPPAVILTSCFSSSTQEEKDNLCGNKPGKDTL